MCCPRCSSDRVACQPRPAFSLLEMTVVLAALQILLALIAGILWATVRIERSAAADFQRTLNQDALAEQFRTDVANAAAAPLGLDDLVAGPDCLILRKADGSKVIYRWAGERLERSETTKSGTTVRHLPLGVEQARVEFTRAEDGRLLTLRLTEVHGLGNARRQHLVVVTAALGGDLR
jgi:hypothetical protein